MKNIFSRIKINSIGMLCIAASLVGCTSQFEKWNTNPNEATDEMMETDNLSTGSYFVQMAKNLMPIEQLPEIGADAYQVTQNLHADVYSGYMGATGTWLGGKNSTTYNLTQGWYSRPFDLAFTKIMPAWLQVKRKSEVAEPHVYAMATVLKVGAMHRITDMYGPLPYTHFGESSLTIPYDTQEAIYDKFFEELDEAITTLTEFYERDHDATILANYDLVFGGNVQKWIKYANTLRLRLAMRIVYADASKAQAQAELAVNHSVGVITEASEVVALDHTYANYRHPLFVIGEGEFKETKMGATMDSYLNGYNDPRISSYFKPVGGKYIGVRGGIRIPNKEAYAEGPFSFLNISASQNLVWVNPAESYFLRAEGAVRGWNMNGTAEELYKAGVKTSFDYLGVAGVDDYLKNETDTPTPYVDSKNSGNSVEEGSPLLATITVKWDESASQEVKLERVITQKWIAMFPDGQEAWSEFRRTGYPKVFPVRENHSGNTIDTNKQIRRLPFPLSEYQNNEENVKAALGLLGGDDTGGVQLWWDKKGN